MHIESEIWLPVTYPEYAAYYQVSDHGRVKSFPRANVKEVRICTPTMANGTYAVCLCVGCQKKTVRLSKLVALAHVPNPNPNKLTSVGHNNGDITDNRGVNLKWIVRPATKKAQQRSQLEIKKEVETMEGIMVDIANVFNVDINLIKEGSKAGICSIVRKIFYYVCRTKHGYSLESMAIVAGKACHSGPSLSIGLIKHYLKKKDPDFMVLWGHYLQNSKIFTQKDFK